MGQREGASRPLEEAEMSSYKPVTKWRAAAPGQRSAGHTHTGHRAARSRQEPPRPAPHAGNRAQSPAADPHREPLSTDSAPRLLLLCLSLAAALIGGIRSEGVCLQDGKHKAAPGPEPHLSECGMYADNSCCSEEHIQDVSYLPSASSKNEPWDKCGPLSAECEGFLKRVSCFYRCSPDAARWPHPQRRSYIQAVPLCHSFCRDWFDACRMDLTCARNWARDPRGQNCTGTCVQYQQLHMGRYEGQKVCHSVPAGERRAAVGWSVKRLGLASAGRGQLGDLKRAGALVCS
ncbi:riboflavin-binding protein-like [Salarias fasciatus]|uniref:riboflavin-binding protein-like n=1 Tax=Salarias fasciatus TaxID=181472 RepID=UPI0011770311|nr:riboflavin-binding protein-like [Salarias fasciatus]